MKMRTEKNYENYSPLMILKIEKSDFLLTINSKDESDES